jgi:hypothetical protein
MSKASQIILLCEDKLQEVVVRRFLTKGWIVSPRTIRVIPYPKGKGSGEGHVRTRYPEELKAYRTRPAKTILIVVIDADTETVRQHHLELGRVCESVPPRQVDDAVLHVIPKRNIETWLAYLDGQSVVEDENYKAKYQFRGKESDCQRLVDQLSEKCKKNTPLVSPPPSLLVACEEFRLRVAPFL